MIYIITRWDGEKYIILHYTHDFDDAERMHQLWLSRHRDVRLMCDVRVLDIHESTLKIKALKKKLQDAKNQAAKLANECGASGECSGTTPVVQQ